MRPASPIRLVKAAKLRHPELSLSRIRALIAAGRMLVNGRKAKIAATVSPRDTIAVDDAALRDSLVPNAELPCRLIRRTRGHIFFEKGSGVHAVAHDSEETNSAANWLAAIDPALPRLGPLECGLAHRLDFETSGVMVAARDAEALAHLRGLFRKGGVEKIYVCLTRNSPPPGRHEARVAAGRRSAGKIRLAPAGHNRSGTLSLRVVTEVLKVEKEGKHRRVTLRLVTGFRHQIRAHMALLGCPILGDTLYGGEPAPRLMLHARAIAFRDGDGRPLSAAAPEPF